MAEAETRTFTPYEKAQQWAQANIELEDKQEQLRKLEEDIELRERHVRSLQKEVADSVGAKRPRRIFDLGHTLVVVERYKKPKRKHKVGAEPPPDEFGVRVSLVEAETA